MLQNKSMSSRTLEVVEAEIQSAIADVEFGKNSGNIKAFTVAKEDLGLLRKELETLKRSQQGNTKHQLFTFIALRLTFVFSCLLSS